MAQAIPVERPVRLIKNELLYRLKFLNARSKLCLNIILHYFLKVTLGQRQFNQCLVALFLSVYSGL